MSSLLAAATLALAITLLAGCLWIRALRQQVRLARYAAGHDALTGLPNRRAAMAHLAGQPVGAVGLLDLDHFKKVNDLHGHHIGDELLITLAARLSSAMSQRGTVYRLAGDEFLLVWNQPPELRDADTLLAQITRPLTLGGHDMRPSASLGLALPGPHLGGADLITAADAAMYDAKHRTHDGQASQVHLYTSDHPPVAQPGTGRRTNRITKSPRCHERQA